MKPPLQERLRTLQIEVDDAVTARHLAAVEAELRNPGPVAIAPRRPRVRVATLFAAALLLALPTAALAAESAVPGDLLYPVKLAVEQVVGLVDPNIEAEHRVEELETVVERSADPDEVDARLADAEDAIAREDVPEDLVQRFERVRDRARTATRGDADRQADDDTPPSTTTESPTEPEPSTTTTTIADRNGSDRPGHSDDQMTTTTEGSPGHEGPPRRDAPTTTEPPRDRPPRDGRG